jgi:hypothetical protein
MPMTSMKSGPPLELEPVGRKRSAEIWTVAVALAVLLVSAAAAEPFRCPGSTVAIFAPHDGDNELACQGAADAIAFMRAQGMTVNHPLELP